MLLTNFKLRFKAIFLLLSLIARQASCQLKITCYEWVNDPTNPSQQVRKVQRTCPLSNTCFVVVQSNGKLYGSCANVFINECDNLNKIYPGHLYSRCCKEDKCNVAPDPLPKPEIPAVTTLKTTTTKKASDGKEVEVDISGLSQENSANGRFCLSGGAFVWYLVLRLFA